MVSQMDPDVRMPTAYIRSRTEPVKRTLQLPAERPFSEMNLELNGLPAQPTDARRLRK